MSNINPALENAEFLCKTKKFSDPGVEIRILPKTELPPVKDQIDTQEVKTVKPKPPLNKKVISDIAVIMGPSIDIPAVEHDRVDKTYRALSDLAAAARKVLEYRDQISDISELRNFDKLINSTLTPLLHPESINSTSI